MPVGDRIGVGGGTMLGCTGACFIGKGLGPPGAVHLNVAAPWALLVGVAVPWVLLLWLSSAFAFAGGERSDGEINFALAGTGVPTTFAKG